MNFYASYIANLGGGGGGGGGTPSDSFTIWQPDHGTSPTASTPTDTMDVTSSDASVTITGNASTKTLNFQVAGGPFLPLAGGTMSGSVNFGAFNITNLSELHGGSGGLNLFDGAGQNSLTLFGTSIYWRGDMLWRDNNTYDIGAPGSAPRNLRLAGNLGVGNFTAASTLGTVIGKVEIFTTAGVSSGFIPVYDTIT